MRVIPIQSGIRIDGDIQSGDRIGRWLLTGKSKERKHYFTALCDCGHEAEVYKGQLRAGRSMSCGCLAAERSSARVKDSHIPNPYVFNEGRRNGISESMRKRWRNGEGMTPALRVHVEEMGRRQAGVPETGVNAAGVQNKAAKYWRLMAPSGEIVEGVNLRQVVRDHRHLFDAADVTWRVGATGLGRDCRASLGLSKLFLDGDNRRNSWKGWTGIQRGPKEAM